MLWYIFEGLGKLWIFYVWDKIIFWCWISDLKIVVLVVFEGVFYGFVMKLVVIVWCDVIVDGNIVIVFIIVVDFVREYFDYIFNDDNFDLVIVFLFWGLDSDMNVKF